VTALHTRVDGARWTYVYAPGAGANIDDPFGKHLASTLPARGIAVVRFQFPYMEAGRKSPDRPVVLEATWRAVLAAVRGGTPRIAAGGRSMGGRVGSMVVAAGEQADALALFAYPLHPPGKPDQRRIEHFPDIRIPALFCSGTNDAFASPEELREVGRMLTRATVHLLDGADHGFAVRKSSGRTREQVYDEATEALVRFLDGIR
jgi:predicted alpha/beta-hydrolase family hydrolase